MRKLKNATLQNFLEKFIEEMEREKGYSSEYAHKLNIPFIISSLCQSFDNNPSDYEEFIRDLENYPNYSLCIEDSPNNYDGIIDVHIYLSNFTIYEKDIYTCNEKSLNYEYLLSFTYDERFYDYCMCTPEMEDYREDKKCCGHGCDATFCEFSLQKIFCVKRDSWNGDEHDYWDFEDEFYKSDEDLAEKKREEDREREIKELKSRIENDMKKLAELEGEV